MRATDFLNEEHDDMFAPVKDLARRMAVLIGAGKEIWVKDSRNEVWKINKVERDPAQPKRWLARWDYGEFVVDDDDFELRPVDGHMYWFEPKQHISEETELDEGASSILYHYTSPAPALRILKSGEFELTSSIGSQVEAKIAPKGYPYYLSTTRNKLGDYHARIPGSHAVMFVLNGTKLSHNYKVKPVDYWEGMWQRDNANQRTHEAEDRVFSKTPTIPTAGIIKEIHQLVTDQDEFRSPVIRQLAILAKTQGIPIYFYADKESWLLQAPNRRITVSQLPNRFAGPAKQGWVRHSSRISRLEQWVELLYKKNKSELSQEANELRYNLVYYGARYPEEDQSLANDLTNARKPNEPDRKYAATLIEYMRKYNLSTVDFKNAMVEKWSKAP